MVKDQILGIKQQILNALSHEEAEEGLYFNNLIVVHEEEARPIVTGSEDLVRVALDELVKDGRIEADSSGESPIYKLKSL